MVKAMDGTTAITLTESENPDLVLLDLRLPELDGFSGVPEAEVAPRHGAYPNHYGYSIDCNSR